jgi:hypothetical protein
MNIDRNLILQYLTTHLQPLEYINALWLEGADGLRTVDEFSDIDIWVDVADGKEEQTISDIRSILSRLGVLDFDFEKQHGHPKIRQHFFHIKNTPKFLIIDLCVQSASREFWFTDGMDGEKVKIIFDKKSVVTFKPSDRDKFNKEISKRKKYLLNDFKIMKIDVEKELERGDYLGALNFYISLARIFTEIQRLEYSPTKHDFGLKHASRDLPLGIAEIIRTVYKFSTIDDLKNNIAIMITNLT